MTTAAEKLSLGMQRLSDAGDDPLLLGQALLTLHGALVVVLLALTAFGAQVVTQRATATGQRAHSLARVQLPGGDLAIVAVPARPRRAGAVALWWAGTTAPRVRELISLPGAPAARLP